ncbi:hypothetical protein ACOMHN_039941 [Nucella lapillus]
MSLFPMMEHLYLSFNNISVIEKGCFRLAPRLAYLDMSSNPLGPALLTTPDALSRLQHLRELYLHNNGLQAIYPGALDGFDSLQQIVLNDNSLRTLSVGLQPALQQMPRLQAM